MNGEPFVIELVPGAPGLRADAVLPIQSDKVWWQYRVIVGDTSTNPLGETHTFEHDRATIERRPGATWGAVPDGTFLDHVWTDPNDVSTVDAPDRLVSQSGTVGGTCTFIVSSTGPTTGNLAITGIRDTWLDRRTRRRRR